MSKHRHNQRNSRGGNQGQAGPQNGHGNNKNGGQKRNGRFQDGQGNNRGNGANGGNGSKPWNGNGSKPWNGNGSKARDGNDSKPWNGNGNKPWSGNGSKPWSGNGNKPRNGRTNVNAQGYQSVRTRVECHAQEHPDYVPAPADEGPAAMLWSEAVAAPQFGFQREWSSDALLDSVMEAAAGQGGWLGQRLAELVAGGSYTSTERAGALRFLFVAPQMIAVGAHSGQGGAFRVGQRLDAMASGADELARDIAAVFYAHNRFFFRTPDELRDFVANTPSTSLALVRHVCFGSDMVRRGRGLQQGGRRGGGRGRQAAGGAGGRTPEDLQIERDLRCMPRLDQLSVALGFDIDDQHHRYVVGYDWCLKHPNYPMLDPWRLDEETLPGSTTSREMILVDDRLTFGWMCDELRRYRCERDDKMDLSD